MSENYINHVVLVLDESSSMHPHRRDLIRVADGHIQYLARRSKELDQETRVSVYTFADTVQCRIYDKDVLRLPSIADLYRPNGMTALIDATVKSLDDLALTPQLYGDHAFLAFVLTDGAENRSRATSRDLSTRLNALPAHWTVAVLVPNQIGKFEAQGFGFPTDNIAIWDPSNAAGIAEAGTIIERATENFMTNRSRGVRGTRALFSTGADAVNVATVTATLAPLSQSVYDVLPVHSDAPIRDYVHSRGLSYTIGHGYYQLTKTETIQAGKGVAVREKRTGRFYTGPAARDLLGLPAMDVRVKPDYNPDFDVFVQSTSVNRRLVVGTDLLIIK